MSESPQGPSTPRKGGGRRVAGRESASRVTPPTSPAAPPAPPAPPARPRAAGPLLALVLIALTAAALVLAGLTSRPTGTPQVAQRTAKVGRAFACTGGVAGATAQAGARSGFLTLDGKTPSKNPVSLPRTRFVQADATAAASAYAVQSARASNWLAAETCPDPQAQWWFVGAGGSASHNSTLRLSNPLPGEAIVDVDVYGDKGPLNAPGLHGINVGAGKTVRLRLSEVAPSIGELGVHVSTSRGLVAASVSETWARSFVAKRVQSWVPGQLAASTHPVLTGFPESADSADLFVVNPGDAQAVVTVSYRGADGAFKPSKHSSLMVPPGSVATLPVDKAGKAWPYAVSLSSSIPVSASVRAVRKFDESPSTPGPDLGAFAVAGVPAGVSARLRLVPTDSTSRSNVTLKAFDANGRLLSSSSKQLSAGAAWDLALPAKTRSIMLTGAHHLAGSVLLTQGNGIASIALTAAAPETRVPQARPGW